MAWVATQGIEMMGALGVGYTVAPAFTTTLLDGATEKFDWTGYVWNKDRATKNITKVAFLPGAITSAGGSQMRISLQNVDAATSVVVARGDGTQDQTVDFLASDVTDSTWYKTAALSATRTVAFGELMACRLEFNSFLGADAFNVRNLTGNANYNGIGGIAHFTGTWAGATAVPNIVFEFDDGTFGTFVHGHPCASIVSTSVNTGSTPDEVALKFQVLFPCKIDAVPFVMSIASAARDFDVVLYEGTTALQTVSVDADYVAISTGSYKVVAIPETELTPGVDYYVAVKPTTAANIIVYSFTVGEANHFQAMPGGTTWHHATRVDAGAWTATTTQRPWMGIRISALSDGAGGGSTGVIGG